MFIESAFFYNSSIRSTQWLLRWFFLDNFQFKHRYPIYTLIPFIYWSNAAVNLKRVYYFSITPTDVSHSKMDTGLGEKVTTWDEACMWHSNYFKIEMNGGKYCCIWGVKHGKLFVRFEYKKAAWVAFVDFYIFLLSSIYVRFP